MKHLKKTIHTFEVEDEEEAMALIEEYKNNQLSEGYTLTKSGYTLKTKKSKGEIIDSWAICNIEMTYEGGR